jgi:hypothetical protein
VGLADRLDVLHGSTARLASLWFLVPVLAGSSWLALSARRARLAATLAASVGLLSLVGAEVTVRSPLAAELGVAVARGAGTVAVAAAALHLVMHRRPDDV